MSTHDRVDFPPDWQPPPRRFPGEPPTTEVLNMLQALADAPHAGWVGALYSRRFRDRLRHDPEGWPKELLSHHAVQLAAILTRLPQGPEMARALQARDPYSYSGIERTLDRDRVAPPDQRVSPDELAALETLLQIAVQGERDTPHDSTRARSPE